MALGGGKMANEIVGGIKNAVAAAMADAKKEIAGATTELVAEIRDGAKNVKRAIQAEVVNVRKEFGEIVGNATTEAEDAVEEARKLAADAKVPTLGQAVMQANDTVPGSTQHDMVKATFPAPKMPVAATLTPTQKAG